MMASRQQHRGQAAYQDRGQHHLDEAPSSARGKRATHAHHHVSGGRAIITHDITDDGNFAAALLRHPAVRIAHGICYGRTDVPLADGWRRSIPALAVSLSTIAARHIWSSPSSRCALLAAALGSRLALPVTCDERLRELDFGAWEGRAWDSVPRHDLDLWAADPLAFRPPGGERGADLVARVGGFAAVLRAAARPCIVVSHGGPLRLLPELLGDTPASLLATPPPAGSLRIVAARPMTGYQVQAQPQVTASTART